MMWLTNSRSMTKLKFTPQGRLFFGLLAAMAVAKIALVWDQPVMVVNGPHDDSLYVYRAVHLLAGDAFGPYTSTMLVKYPGLSLWLAAGGSVGLPYLRTLNILYVVAGLYLCAGLRAVGVPYVGVAIAAILYLFNPFTFDVGWTRTLREPLSTVLLVLLSASLLFIVKELARSRVALMHVIVFSGALSLATLCREEDVLLYIVPLGALTFLLFDLRHSATGRRAAIARTLFALALPIALSLGANAGVRLYVAQAYGLPILHDFGEGEFPRMVAALRSVRAKRDNRYVMVPQETLAAVAREVPLFEPVVRRLPKPSRDTVSCEWLGLCTEWGSGWLLFWIKDAAYDAGLTNTLPAGQAYFRAVRAGIEQACLGGRLECTPKGAGLIPPFELRWTRALVHEAADLARMLLRPDVADKQIPTSVHPRKLEETVAAITRSPVMAAPSTLAEAAMRDSPMSASLQQLHGVVTMLFMLLAGGACLFALTGDIKLSPALGIALTALGAYILIRFAALPYLGIFMGRYDPRIVMSTHVLLTPLCVSLFAIALARIWDDRCHRFAHG